MTKPTKPVIFQCDEQLKNEASTKLADCGISMSEYLRTCLEAFVYRNSNKNIKAEVLLAANDAITSFTE